MYGKIQETNYMPDKEYVFYVWLFQVPKYLEHTMVASMPKTRSQKTVRKRKINGISDNGLMKNDNIVEWRKKM